jgi:hypothetical protein
MSREALDGAGVVQTQYVVPKVSGDAKAAFRLAVAYQDLADAVRTAHHRVAAIVDGLSGWHGEGRRAIDGPVEAFLRNAALLATALDRAAAVYDSYGQRLAKAHEHHGLSMHKLLKVGAIAAVSATAIVVTVGAAGVVEAGVAAAAVGGAAEAAGTAASADLVAAGALDAALEALPALRPLLAFILPQLVQAEWAIGSMAVYDELTTDQLRWRALAQTGAVAFVASGAATAAVPLVGGGRWVPPLVEGSAWAGAAAADDAITEHRFTITDVAESFVLAGGSTVGLQTLRAHGLWFAERDYRRAALVALLHRGGRITDSEIAHELARLRQPVEELQRGRVDLWLNEGPGHTIARHVARTPRQLLAEIRSSRSPLATTYWDEPEARDAIEQTLAAHRATIQRWSAAGCPGQLRLHLMSGHHLGFTLDRRNTVRLVSGAVVVLRRDSAGVVLVTSHPVS